MITLPKGMITVEDAAQRVGWEPSVLRDWAALVGAPLGYGPFGPVPDSAYHIAIDADDLSLWKAAGCPMSTYYRPKKYPPRKPRRSWWEGVKARWRGEE